MTHESRPAIPNEVHQPPPPRVSTSITAAHSLISSFQFFAKPSESPFPAPPLTSLVPFQDRRVGRQFESGCRLNPGLTHSKRTKTRSFPFNNLHTLLKSNSSLSPFISCSYTLFAKNTRGWVPSCPSIVDLACNSHHLYMLPRNRA
jgi:hypothetical protein